MNILAVEDDMIFANTLEILVETLGYTFHHVDNAKDLFKKMPTVKPDLLLLDININGDMNGIQIAEKIQATGNVMPIIFVTSFQDKTTFDRAKKTNPFAYILKPFDEKTLQLSIELAIYKAQSVQTETQFVGWQQDLLLKESFFIKVGDRLEKIHISDIAHISVEDKYLNIYTEKKMYLARLALHNIMEKLPEDTFFRVHRNTIINVNFIENIYPKDSQIEILGKKILYSSRYGETLMRKLNLIL